MAKKKKGKRGGKRKGAGRPLGEEGRAITLTASVPESLVLALGHVMEQEGWTKSEAVTEAIRGLVKRKGGA